MCHWDVEPGGGWALVEFDDVACCGKPARFEVDLDGGGVIPLCAEHWDTFQENPGLYSTEVYESGRT
jgi:hypothetical protein